MAYFEDKQSAELVKDLREKEEIEVAKMIASRYSFPFIDLGDVSIELDALKVIPEEISRANKVVAYERKDKKIKIAILSPREEHFEGMLDSLRNDGYIISIYITTNKSLEKAWGLYKDISRAVESKTGALDIGESEIESIIKNIHSIDEVKKKIEEVLVLKKGFRISKILESVTAGALALKASDIHVEPEEDYVRLRYRLDGVLVDIITFDFETYNLLLSRIKLLSGLKLNVKKEAQDGRFSINLTNTSIEVRTSILPGAYSESVVMHPLDPKSISVPLEDLGVNPKLLKILEREIDKPEGMILTTGPTGSGKTTTLYAFLRKIHNPGVKIITIEDPIEYHLEGITQTQVNEKGYTFLEGLRSALRQDPDVIMVGEIRDEETAKIAVNSAQTGHLVFSTLHTNSAAGAYPRLVDLDVNPKILISAISLSLAQRLVRKLCQNCKKEKILAGKEKVLVDKILSEITSGDKPEQTEKVFENVGCSECNNTGYKGRVGIYEAIIVDDEIEKIVVENPSEREIKKVAKSQGILTLEEDGILKVLSGPTSLSELSRVVELE